MCHELRAALGVGIWIIAVELLILGKAVVLQVVVLVDLVRGDVEKASGTGVIAEALEDVYGSHDIGLVGVARILVGIANNGLRCEMKDDVRIGLYVGFLK